MSQETQDLVSWPRDLCGKLRLACEGTDSPTGVYRRSIGPICLAGSGAS